MNVVKERSFARPTKARAPRSRWPRGLEKGHWRRPALREVTSEKRLRRQQGGGEATRNRVWPVAPLCTPDPAKPHPLPLCTPGQGLAGIPSAPRTQPSLTRIPSVRRPCLRGPRGRPGGAPALCPARSAVALGPFAGGRGSSPRAAGYQSLNRRNFCKYRPGPRKGPWSAGPRGPPTGGGGQEAPSDQMLKTDENE